MKNTLLLTLLLSSCMISYSQKIFKIGKSYLPSGYEKGYWVTPKMSIGAWEKITPTLGDIYETISIQGRFAKVDSDTLLMLNYKMSLEYMFHIKSNEGGVSTRSLSFNDKTDLVLIFEDSTIVSLKPIEPNVYSKKNRWIYGYFPLSAELFNLFKTKKLIAVKPYVQIDSGEIHLFHTYNIKEYKAQAIIEQAEMFDNIKK